MKILHTGITVKDIGRSVDFYSGLLGLDLIVAPTPPAEGEELSRGVGVPGACLRQALLGSEDCSIELFEYLNPPAEVSVPLPVNNPGPGHVAFGVEDIDSEYERLLEKGVFFFSEPNQITEGPLKGWKWVYFKDPDGIVLELIEKGSN